MQKKVNILVAGASGYGNIGDDSYREVLGAYSEGRSVHFTFDSPYPDIQSVVESDLLLIGGGGLIYCNDTAHFDYMSMYLDTAITHKKPFAFISCGVQPRNINGQTLTTEEIAEQIRPWKPYLDKAAFISVRSEKDAEIIKSLSTNLSVLYYPDLGYLTPASSFSLRRPGTTLIIPTKSMVSSLEWKQYWNELLDSCTEGDKKNITIVAFSRDDEEVVHQLNAELGVQENLVSRTRFSPREAVALCAEASQVITGRYHGHVLARAAGKSYDEITIIDRRHKSAVENYKQDITLAKGHLTLLSLFIDDYA